MLDAQINIAIQAIFRLENENISQANKDMYRSILEQELESKYIGKKPKEKQNNRNHTHEAYSLTLAIDIVCCSIAS